MTNFALNKKASVSSTSKWSSNSSACDEARLGNNGDKYSDIYFHTGKEFDPWWQVEFDEVISIERVEITNRDSYAHRLKVFLILWSNDGDVWHEYYRNDDRKPFNRKAFESKRPSAARFLRVQIVGYNYLHLKEVEVFGDLVSKEDEARIMQAIGEAASRVDFEDCYEGRQGEIATVGSVKILNDVQYPERVRRSLDRGSYEGNERRLVGELLQPGDRLLEIGTAVGAVAMTAARIIGEENVLTFDANPEIVEHARQNFKYNGLNSISARNGVLKNKNSYLAGEEVQFHVAEAFWASRLFIGYNDSDIVRTVKVPTFCLESEIENFGATSIVCDIEGGEADLLNGAILDNIRLIIMETHYWAIGEDKTDRMISYLIGQGFFLHLGLSANQVVVLRRHV